jgi:hypothetical protein
VITQEGIYSLYNFDTDNLKEYDLGTEYYLTKHFIITTNPFNILATSKQLEEAKVIVEKYRFV